MSRPQKIIPPIKGTFTDIINSVADGRGVPQSRPKESANEKSTPPPPKEPPKKP